MGFIADVIRTFFSREIQKPIKQENIIQQPEVEPKTIKKVFKEKQNTKYKQVLKHLIEKGTIDSWTAINLYGATRLSDIIFRLRNRGYDIVSIHNTAYDRNKELCNFTTYKYNNNGAN
jgi:hypothetical protein